MENNGKIMKKKWIKNQLYITFYIIFFNGSALLTLRVYRVLVSLQCNYNFLYLGPEPMHLATRRPRCRKTFKFVKKEKDGNN